MDPITLAIAAIALGFLGVSCDGDSQTPIDDDQDAGGEDVYLPPSACKMAPRILEGNGSYEARTGDRIVADNGVYFVIGMPGPDPEGGSIYFFGADFYIGEEKLNFLPLQFYGKFCSELYGINFTHSTIQETECGSALNVGFESTYPGTIASRQDLYSACREEGRLHSECVDFIPYEPAATETMYSDESFQVITPSDANPVIGEYFLNQLQYAYDPLVEFFGVEEILPRISLRWYLADGLFNAPHTHYQIKWPPAWPGTEESQVEFIQREEEGNLTTMASNNLVVHELSHLLRYHVRIPRWLEEGLARYAETHVTQRPPAPLPPILEETISLNQPLSIPGFDYPVEIEFITYSAEERSVFESSNRLWFGEKSSLLWTENILLTVDIIDGTNFTVRVFQSEEGFGRRQGWMFDQVAECFETGYVKPTGVWISDTFYRAAGGDGGTITLQDYVSLSEDNPLSGEGTALFYDTAFCLFQGLRELYGHEVIQGFLQEADRFRRDSLETNSFSLFCATEALEAAVGEDLSEYFSRFKPPTDCTYVTGDIPLYGSFGFCPSVKP